MRKTCFKVALLDIPSNVVGLFYDGVSVFPRCNCDIAWHCTLSLDVEDDCARIACCVVRLYAANVKSAFNVL